MHKEDAVERYQTHIWALYKLSRDNSSNSRGLFGKKESECSLKLGCLGENIVSRHIYVANQQDALSKWLFSAGIALSHTHVKLSDLEDKAASSREFQLRSATVNKICTALTRGGFILSCWHDGPSLNGLLEFNHTWQPCQNLMHIHKDLLGFPLPRTEQLKEVGWKIAFSFVPAQMGNNKTQNM